jgi:hypothetical protein
MKYARTGIGIVALMVVLLSSFAAHPALAGSYSVSGTLDSNSPTMPQTPIISTPNCTGAYAAFAVQYRSVAFTVTAPGTYTFTETASPNTAFYLYAGSFNPAAGANCIAASNTNPLNISYALATGTTYYLVVINDTFSQDPMNYVLTISGPGDIYEVGGGCDSQIAIPSTAVGAAFVADAPVYWTPGQLTSPLVTLQAGKTVRAIGLDSTGQYYKILFQCQFLWVPVNTLGPNYDNVWNGAPLPTAVVN